MSDVKIVSKKSSDGPWDIISVVFQALIIALVVRTFIVQPFNIPSGSMKDTLLVGDYIFVSKWSYGFSKHSFPYSIAPFEGRIFATEPERGDIIVFKLPSDTNIDYVKRLIGLPGDHVQMKDGVLYINGTAVKREATTPFVEKDAFGRETSTPAYIETLPNGKTYRTLDSNPNGPYDNTQEFIVPPGHYFMMGDNRDNSQDSRVPGGVGYVPFENLVGKASVVFFSIGEDARAWEIWKWPTAVRFSRLLSFPK